jgi:endoglucanase
VVYTANTWSNGFTADVRLTNNGAAVTAWTLTFTVGGTTTLTNGWNGTWSQSGTTLTARNVDWNGNLPSGGTVTTGFQASFTGSNPPPAAFALNGTSCGS